MNAPLRCNCAECQRLDKLPVRKQGWPNCYQLLLPTSIPVDVAVPDFNFAGPRNAVQKEVDSLPLFGGGADEPYLL